MSHTCKNCGNIFEGNYCNYCGQAAETHEINASFVLHDLQHGLIHLDGGILHSARELFTRPGHSVRDYIEGKRIKHYKPFSMLIVVAGLYGLLYHTLKIDPYKDISDSTFNYKQFNEWISHHFSIITLTLLPVLSLNSFLLFHKQGYNFTEHLVINAFYSTQKLWLRILTLPVILWAENAQFILKILLVIDFALMLWIYGQFFKNISRIKTFILTLSAAVLNFLIVLTATSIVIMFTMP